MLLDVIKTNALALFNTDAATLTMMWQTVVLGTGMVFAVLGLLWAILSVFKLVFTGATPKTEKKEQPTPQKAEPVQTPEPATDDGELVAVITAAVAAYMEAEGTAPAGGFRVVSFTRVRGARPWNSK
jgi:sodium pump decarboxylase gamma subunit